RQSKLNKRFADLQTAKVNTQEQGLQILELVKDAHRLYESKPIDAKRELLGFVLSNFTLNGKEPKPQLHFIFEQFAEIKAKRNVVETAGVEPASKMGNQ
ncbi:MAG: hypothetical protein KC476_06595, partial [Cyanobacteria bacterium HKST-UBA06]|nr:hypothetical protein [Cyanobacteria bacterium HKST-UBA06]